MSQSLIVCSEMSRSILHRGVGFDQWTVLNDQPGKLVTIIKLWEKLRLQSMLGAYLALHKCWVLN